MLDTTRTDLIHTAIVAQLSHKQSTKKDYSQWLNSTTVLLGLGVMFIVFASLFDAKPKAKLASSSWGGASEIAKAKKKAKRQIASPTRNKVSLYINSDKSVDKKIEAYWQKIGWENPVKIKKKKRKKGEPKPKPDSKIPSFYIPDVQRGVAIIGGAGTGKTFSAIDPMARSAADQGFPIVLYDFKYPEQSSRLAAYAKIRGYDIEVFAPGYAESCVCNILEMIRDENDSIAAGQLAKTVIANTTKASAKSDAYFEKAGEAFIEGVLLLTKAVPKILVSLDPNRFADANGQPNEAAWSYCDVVTTNSILALPDIAKRLHQAKEAGIIGGWSGIPLDQTISVKDAEKTVAGIVSTAQNVFRGFIKRDFVPAFIGKSNIPERIEGKKLLIFGLDNINRDIISPILASVLHMKVRDNIYGKVKRKDPLICLFDELKTIRLPALTNWLNEGREMGFCGILGFQNISQLEETYGKEVARQIIGGCATKFIFNPQENESAKIFSDMLGETEITYTTTSKSRSSGKSSSTSRSTSVNRQKKQLYEPAQFLRLIQGRAVILNPNYIRGKEGYMPILKELDIRQLDEAHQNWSVEQWPSILQYIQNQRSQQIPAPGPAREAYLTQVLLDRNDLAKVILPLAEKPAAA